jgi:hypothetical protein
MTKPAIHTAKWAKNRKKGKKADFLATLAKMSALALGQRVREKGLEPARPCGHQALNLARLAGHTFARTVPFCFGLAKLANARSLVFR